MTFSIYYTEKARGDLHKIDKESAQRVIRKILWYSQQKNPLTLAKPLKNNLIGKYRFRVGDYRIIFDCDSKGNIHLLIILTIKHRKDIYRL